MKYSYSYITPIGRIFLAEENGRLTDLRFWPVPGAQEAETALLRAAAEQLREYFGGKRRTFDLPLDARGTPFQQSVWSALLDIPCGGTRTYGEIAAEIGSPGACRAVGMANNRNPLSILIPCHRVVGANGGLVGYGGGLEVKEKLLALEKRYM